MCFKKIFAIKVLKNVTSVFYIFNKINFFLILHFSNITRLNLACFNKNIYFYLNLLQYHYRIRNYNFIIFQSLPSLFRIIKFSRTKSTTI